MVAGAYIVSVSGDGEGRSLVNGVDSAVVYAGSSADALALTRATYAKVMPAVWAAAVPLLVAPAADLTGWKLHIQVLDTAYGNAYDVGTSYAFGDIATLGGVSYQNIQVKGSVGVPPTDADYWAPAPQKVSADVTVVGAANATVDTLAAAAVTALNSSGNIAGAAYNAGTNVLTVAAGSDALGDNIVVAAFIPSGAGEFVSIPGFVVSKVDNGVSSAALTVTLAADGYTVPKVVGKFRRS
jgi:hypothetical protein